MDQSKEKRYTLRYEVKRETRFNQYTAVVYVDQYAQINNVRVFLYVGEPLINFFGIKIGNDFVRYTICDATDNINEIIEGLIKDYELPLYQKEKAESVDPYIEIDYELEIAKIEEQKRREQERRRQEYERLKLKYQLSQEQEQHFEPIITIWDENLPQYQQQEQENEHEPKRKYNPKSLLNLKQYQHLKNEF